MNGEDIVNQIKAERKNHVIIQWNKNGLPGNKSTIVTSECWGVIVTDEPEEYFAEQSKIHNNRPTHCSKIEISSFEEGLRLFNELNNHFNGETGPVAQEDIYDPSKQLYLAIHIHYHIE